MPSANPKLEKQASTEAVDPIRQAIIVIEHKIRNLEKRKVSNPACLIANYLPKILGVLLICGHLSIAASTVVGHVFFSRWSVRHVLDIMNIRAPAETTTIYFPLNL